MVRLRKIFNVYFKQYFSDSWLGGAFITSCNHRWKTVVLWHSYNCSHVVSLSLSLSDIHLWKTLLLHPSLAGFHFPSQIFAQHNPCLIPERSHIDAQESAMLISMRSHRPWEINESGRRAEETGGADRPRLRLLLQSTSGLSHFSTNGVMDFTAMMKALQYLSPYSAHASWFNVKTSSLLNLCFFSSCSPDICFFSCFLGFTCSFQHRRWHRRSAAAPLTHTAQQYKLCFSAARGTSPHSLWPRNCSCKGSLSQLAKPNPIYYLWRDINSRDCDPLRLNGPLKSSISSSIQYGNLCGPWDLQLFDLR